jgi:hypothetical protein
MPKDWGRFLQHSTAVALHDRLPHHAVTVVGLDLGPDG